MTERKIVDATPAVRWWHRLLAIRPKRPPLRVEYRLIVDGKVVDSEIVWLRDHNGRAQR